MKEFYRAALWAIGGVLGVFGLMYVLGPYEDATLEARFDETRLSGGVGAYFAKAEAAFDDITPGTRKQVVWFGAPEVQTDWSVLYIHGFSATSREIAPVPQQVAQGLGANLVLTRLQGHGRGYAAMADGTVRGWMSDVAEGLAAARAAGRRVLVIATSTGGTLVAAAAHQRDAMRHVAGIVMVSPNFAINNPLTPLLTLPAARYWLPAVAGERRAFTPLNADQDRYWTTEYPSVSVLPMAALVRAVEGLDPGVATVPALFWFSDADQVVVAAATRKVAAAWGGPVTVVNPALGEGDDPSAHVVAGDIVSPGQTGVMVRGISEWVEGL